MPPKKARFEKYQTKIFFTSEKENPWSEDETDTGTTREVNEPIEVDDDISHKASEYKEHGKFQSRWASLYTWLTYNKDKNKMYCSKCISIGANNIMTAGCDNFKTSTLTRHAARADHQKAIIAPKERSNLSTSVNRV